PCKRSSFPPDGEVVYVGDGYSDRCGALAADGVFARRGLAAYLDEQGVAYEPFDDLHTVAAELSLALRLRGLARALPCLRGRRREPLARRRRASGGGRARGADRGCARGRSRL